MNAVLRVLLSTNLEYNLAEAAKAMLGPTTTKWGNRQCFDLRFFYVRMVKSINETLKKIKQFSPGMRRQRGTISSRWRGSKPMQGGWRRWKRVFLSSKWKSGKNGGFPTTIPTSIPLCSQVLSWEDPFKSTYALVTYILMVFYMEPWALPILPLLLLLFHWFHRKAGAKSSTDIFCSFSDEFDIP